MGRGRILAIKSTSLFEGGNFCLQITKIDFKTNTIRPRSTFSAAIDPIRNKQKIESWALSWRQASERHLCLVKLAKLGMNWYDVVRQHLAELVNVKLPLTNSRSTRTNCWDCNPTEAWITRQINFPSPIILKWCFIRVEEDRSCKVNPRCLNQNSSQDGEKWTNTVGPILKNASWVVGCQPPPQSLCFNQEVNYQQNSSSAAP